MIHNSTTSIPLKIGTILLFILVAKSSIAETLETPSLHQGYYFSLIPEGGMVLIDSKRNWGPWPSVGGQFRMGEALTQHLDLGISGGVSTAFGDNYRLIHGHFGVEATLRPISPLAIGLQAGMGFGDFSRQESGMKEVIGRFGATYGITVGYDIYPGHNHPQFKSGGFAFTPIVGAHLGPGDATSVYSFFVGIAVTWWTGLSKNKLNLPPEIAF